MVELNATEYRAFVKAGRLLAELGVTNTLGNITFPLVPQGTINEMKQGLVTLANKRAAMTQYQKYSHNDICSDVAHLVALKA